MLYRDSFGGHISRILRGKTAANEMCVVNVRGTNKVVGMGLSLIHI